ncbi:hypothetical protein [Nocardiopsis trehalosi]|jgi:hypothetical protein|uniref:hypothetical protein n=1 Tax=Nocardiopsis trehalosi TaxID=109329 RepID=UPI0008364F92|nr:hypothetical protein [Nocardiopsis trehalosi]
MAGHDANGPDVLDGAAVRGLRARWCRRSRAAWDTPDDWWTPAVDAVCAAAVAGADLAGACVRLGQARARAGVAIGATLDDFAALCAELGRLEPPLPLVRALAEGWVDGGRSRDDCRDPLTGLATTAYLRTRLGELYRAAGPGAAPAARHLLVIVALEGALDPWRRTARAIVLGHELARFFRAGESIAVLSRSRTAVLAAKGPGLAARLPRLRADLASGHGAALWCAPLPGTHTEALAFLEEVVRPAPG